MRVEPIKVKWFNANNYEHTSTVKGAITLGTCNKWFNVSSGDEFKPSDLV